MDEENAVFDLVEFKLGARLRIFYSFCMLGALKGISLRERRGGERKRESERGSGP